ncbi:MAG: hypothetical protein ACRDL9_21080, partial [Trebonia sp.]
MCRDVSCLGHCPHFGLAAAVRESSLALVADSNRFGASGATSDLDVVNVAAALAGRPAVVGHV